MEPFHAGCEATDARTPGTPRSKRRKYLHQNSVTVRQPENSEVLLAGSVAVAVITCPAAVTPGRIARKRTFPPRFVVTAVEPRRVFPSPCPDGSQEAFEKNCNVKVVLGVLFRLPVTTVAMGPRLTAVRSTGKF